MGNKYLQGKELAKLNPDAFNFNKAHFGGTAERIPASDTFTTYPFEFNLFVKRPDRNYNDVGEVYAKIDTLRIAAKGDAAELLSEFLKDGDSIFFTAWIDTSFCETIAVIDSKDDIAQFRRKQKQNVI